MARELYRTTITLEVLHEGVIPSGMELDEIVRETMNGAYSGDWVSMAQPLTVDEMADALWLQGSEPEFLLGEEWAKEKRNKEAHQRNNRHLAGRTNNE